MIADHGHLSERCFGRSDRSAQSDRPMLRSIRPKRVGERRRSADAITERSVTNDLHSPRRCAVRCCARFGGQFLIVMIESTISPSRTKAIPERPAMLAQRTEYK